MAFYDGNGNVVEIGEKSNLVEGAKLIDKRTVVNTGYSGTQQEQYGSNINLYGALVDVSAEKTLYYKIPVYSKVSYYLLEFGCYDANKTFLYKASDSETVQNVSIANNYSIDGIGTDKNNTVYSIGYSMAVFPDEVKFVQIAMSNNHRALLQSDLFLVGRTPVRDLWQTWDDYAATFTEEFEAEHEKFSAQAHAPLGVFIGDSLTNWGGGNDALDGFLKIIHDKTGIITTNEGYAGAQWQDSDSQTYSAVDRVNAILADGRKYSLYCFLMGTNGGSNTDTGETSADTSTMCGAMRYCLEKLKLHDPTARILVCLPPQRAEDNANQEKVNGVIKTIAESYSVRTLDLYHHSGIVPNTVIADVGYLSDGLHLGANGIQALGDTLAAEIKYLLCL